MQWQHGSNNPLPLRNSFGPALLHGMLCVANDPAVLSQNNLAHWKSPSKRATFQGWPFRNFSLFVTGMMTSWESLFLSNRNTYSGTLNEYSWARPSFAELWRKPKRWFGQVRDFSAMLDIFRALPKKGDVTRHHTMFTELIRLDEP